MLLWEQEEFWRAAQLNSSKKRRTPIQLRSLRLLTRLKKWSIISIISQPRQRGFETSLKSSFKSSFQMYECFFHRAKECRISPQLLFLECTVKPFFSL